MAAQKPGLGPLFHTRIAPGSGRQLSGPEQRTEVTADVKTECLLVWLCGLGEDGCGVGHPEGVAQGPRESPEGLLVL